MRKSLFIIPLCALALTACSDDDGPAPGTVDPGTADEHASPYMNKVYEYLPAPGQFIGETVTGGFTGEESTMQDAVDYAMGRLEKQQFVSLGSFGGYIVVGFDHSIKNSRGDYDFAILGNATDASCEPGIVWVMADANGNGRPDDEWYELRGSETGSASTIQQYSVTYRRPAGPGMDVEWTDSEGNSGTIDYLKAYHKQDYYYPAWVTADSYTLTGTRLEARNAQDPATGNWINSPFDWGYADNLGSDAIADNPRWAAFKISNAMLPDGTPADLDHIDFVKVQQGVMAKSGWIGENSCEVFSFADYAMLFR